MILDGFHRRLMRIGLSAACLVAAASPHGVSLAQVAVVGILEGHATLLRPAGKFDLVEGAALREADIVETAAAAFAQIELSDGVRIGLGGGSRLMLAPAPAASGDSPVRARLLQGWMKLTPPGDRPPAGEFHTPRAAISALAGTCVLNVDATQFALFVESGSVAYSERPAGGPARQARSGDFVAGRNSSALTSSPRPAIEFVERMPRLFRDALPARAARFRDRPVAPRAHGEVSYAEVAAWLQSEESIRVPMIETWRVRLGDKAFRDAVLANLERHPEWRPLVIPPKPRPRIRDRAVAAPATAASEGRIR
jgi:FecR protein